MTRTAVIYCRTSTARQKEHETIGAQVEKCRRLLERFGLETLAYGPRNDGWIMDDGVSGSLLDGRNMAQLLTDLESGAIKPDVLVVYSITRISRVDRTSRKPGKITDSHIAAGRIRGVLITSKVSVIEEDGEVDPASLQFSVKLMLSDEEYKVIRGRTMSGKARRMAEGLYAKGGKPPYGYLQIPVNSVDRKNGWTLAIHPEDSKSLRVILDWYVEGGVTYAARMATEAGIPTPMASTSKRKNQAADWTPTRWSPVSVQHIIRNAAAYLGTMMQGLEDERYQLSYPALITPAQYARILKRTKERTLKRRAVMLTTGFCDCSCGQHIYARNAHGNHFASCAGTREAGPRKACGSMKQERFEAYLSLIMTCRFAQIAEAESVKNTDDEQDAVIDALKKRIASTTERIADLLEIYLSKDLSKQDWKIKQAALESERAKNQAELDRRLDDRRAKRERRANEMTVESRVRLILTELQFQKPSLERQREVLRELLGGERVIIDWVDGGARYTFPPFGTLPALTISSAEDIMTVMLGADAQERLGLYVSTKDAGQPAGAIADAYVAGAVEVGAKLRRRSTRDDGVIQLSMEYTPKP